MYIDQLHELELPQTQLDFCICEIYAHQPLIRWTIYNLRETVRLFKRLGTGSRKDLKYCYLDRCKNSHEMAMENFDKLQDSDIETLVDFSELMGPRFRDLMVRILACMIHDMSWTMQAYIEICERCAWFKEVKSQRRFLIMVYRTAISTQMEEYQQKTDDERAAFKESLSIMLRYSMPSMDYLYLCEMICYAIRTYTSRLIFTFEEIRNIFGDRWIEEFEVVGTGHAVFFGWMLRNNCEEWPDYPRNKEQAPETDTESE